MDTAQQKQALRREARRELAAFCSVSGEREKASRAASAALLSLPEWQQADTVLAYMAMAQEADCSLLIQAAREQHKRLALPRVQGEKDMDFYLLGADRPLAEQTCTGAWGIAEPLPSLCRLQPEKERGRIMVIVPGVAFSRDGGRLGHGKGYYDRYLARLLQGGADIVLCGFCFSLQLKDTLPRDAFDLPMHLIASEKGLIRCPISSSPPSRGGRELPRPDRPGPAGSSPGRRPC